MITSSSSSSSSSTSTTSTTSHVLQSLPSSNNSSSTNLLLSYSNLDFEFVPRSCWSPSIPTYPLLFYSFTGFERIFCMAFKLFDQMWESHHSKIFNTIWQATSEELCSVLSRPPIDGIPVIFDMFGIFLTPEKPQSISTTSLPLTDSVVSDVALSATVETTLDNQQSHIEPPTSISISIDDESLSSSLSSTATSSTPQSTRIPEQSQDEDVIGSVDPILPSHSSLAPKSAAPLSTTSTVTSKPPIAAVSSENSPDIVYDDAGNKIFPL